MSSEATTFIVDARESMASGDGLAKSIAYIEYALFDKSKRGRKTDYVSCYVCNHERTLNSKNVANIWNLSAADSDSDGVSAGSGFLAPVTVAESVRIIRTLESLRETKNATAELDTMVSCLLVAALDFKEEFNKRKLLKQAVIFTNDMNTLDLTEDEIEVLKNELTFRIILVDCSKDGLSYAGSKWHKLIESLDNSLVFPIDSLIRHITEPQPAIVKPVRVFDGVLSLGATLDAVTSDNTLQHTLNDPYSLNIKVEGFPATKPVSSLSRKLMHKPTEDAKIQDSVEFGTLKSVVDYEIAEEKQDDTDPSRITVSKSSITKAYRYGMDYIVLPPTLSDYSVYETFAGLGIISFSKLSSLRRSFLSSESIYIIADTRNGSMADYKAFCALVDAMKDREMIAIARYVAKRDSEVQICALVPVLVRNPDAEEPSRSLILNRLPFKEDERYSAFPKLGQNTSNSARDESDNDSAMLVDDLMSMFVESHSMDDTSCIKDEYYFESIDVSKANPTILPLPNPLTEYSSYIHEMNKEDPLRMPSINLVRQQQVLFEWLHQEFIALNDKFEIPGMPDVITERLELFKGSEHDLEPLLRHLNIKKSDSNTAGSIRDEFVDAVDEVPSLDVLLARGAENK